MMKSFQTYIFELNKPYEFRIKLAGVNPKGETMDKIKSALDTYQLESVTAVKSLPIQEHREFPNYGGPCECWQFDVTVAYPTTVAAIRQVIQERAHINPNWVCVRNLSEAEYTDEAESRGKDQKGALLNDDQLKADEGGQELVGQVRIGSLLKELESRQFDFAEDSNEAGKTTNSVPQGNVSAVGTTKNKLQGKRGQ